MNKIYLSTLWPTLWILLCLAGTALPQEYAADETVGIEEQLGKTVPLDLTFKNERGETVTLGSCIKKPTVLTLIYFRCPSICSPMMHEVAATVDEMDLVAGVDYDLLTISFDDQEGPELAARAKKNLLSDMETRVPPESWPFLTGDAGGIAKLTHDVGYRFKKEKGEFVHSGTVIFLSGEGKIVRYLPGLSLLAADMKLAVLDAAEGKARSFMQKLQQLCYGFDPENKTYVLQVNRIILAGTLALLGVFLAFLLFRGKGKAKREEKKHG